MEFSVVLNHLQNQFSGQLVLYVDDIAKVLGKSDKAISNLITRDALPFKVKTVGGLRCIDIFQVAQWLASDEDIAEESVSVEAGPSPSKVKSTRVQGTTLTKEKKQLTGEAPALTGKMAATLLKMRHSQASAMGRFVHSLRENDDFVFMNEVIEKLFYTVDLLSSSHVVIVKRLAFIGAKVLSDETRKYFETEDRADHFLTLKLDSWRSRKGLQKPKLVEHFILEKSGKTLFHAIARDQKLAVIVNSIGMEFLGE